jgi:hypothetical protein
MQWQMLVTWCDRAHETSCDWRTQPRMYNKLIVGNKSCELAKRRDADLLPHLDAYEPGLK